MMRQFLFAFFCLLSACGADGHINLGQFGFSQIMPPSALYTPGAMIFARHGHFPYTGLVCSARASLGQQFLPRIDMLESLRLKAALERRFDAKIDALAIAGLGAEFETVRHLDVQVRSVAVLRADHEDVRQGIRDRDPLCARAIATRRSHHYHVTMVASAIRADLAVRVVFAPSPKIDPRHIRDVTRELIPYLGIEEVRMTGPDSFEGHGLYLGIIDDMYLSNLDAQDLTAPSPTALLRRFTAETRVTRSRDAPDVF